MGAVDVQRPTRRTRRASDDKLAFFQFPAVDGGAGTADRRSSAAATGSRVGKDAPPERVDFLKYLVSPEVQPSAGAAETVALPVGQGHARARSRTRTLKARARRPLAAATCVQLYLDQAYAAGRGSRRSTTRSPSCSPGKSSPEQVAEDHRGCREGQIVARMAVPPDGGRARHRRAAPTAPAPARPPAPAARLTEAAGSRCSCARRSRCFVLLRASRRSWSRATCSLHAWDGFGAPSRGGAAQLRRRAVGRRSSGRRSVHNTDHRGAVAAGAAAEHDIGLALLLQPAAARAGAFLRLGGLRALRALRGRSPPWIWLLLLQPDGLRRRVPAGRIGLGSLVQEWLADGGIVLYTLFAVIAWKYIGFGIILLAGRAGGNDPGRAGARRRGSTAAVGVADDPAHRPAAARADDPDLDLPLGHRVAAAVRPRVDA